MIVDNQTKIEWNELGFYYEFDNAFNQWRFFGSKHGLEKLSERIYEYAQKPGNLGISEHMHIGPYNYLKVMTWEEPIITKDYIAGTLSDLINLSQMISNEIRLTNVGNIFKIRTQYSPKSTASLLFFIMEDDFPPSFIEFD